MFLCSYVLLEWTREHPLVKRIRLWRWFDSLNKMPRNDYVFNDYKSLPRVLLFEPGGSSAEVLLYGGKVVSWKDSHGEELLFMSRKAGGRSPKGGIFLCFPQLGNMGIMKEICSSKNYVKSLDNIPLRLIPTGNPSSVDLTLKATANDSNMWPRSFELRLRVSLGPDRMTITSHIKNTDNTSFSFTLAFQNYLSVSDISEVRVEGLETLDYLDNLQQGKRFTEQPDAITFDDEVDRVYTRTPGNIAIIDHKKMRTMVIRNEGLPDADLWTPWDNATKANRYGFGDKDYKMMLSVDSGVLEKPIVLKPLEEWKGYQELSLISSSYSSGQLDPKTVAFYAKPKADIRAEGVVTTSPKFAKFPHHHLPITTFQLKVYQSLPKFTKLYQNGGGGHQSLPNPHFPLSYFFNTYNPLFYEEGPFVGPTFPSAKVAEFLPCRFLPSGGGGVADHRRSSPSLARLPLPPLLFAVEVKWQIEKTSPTRKCGRYELCRRHLKVSRFK